MKPVTTASSDVPKLASMSSRYRWTLITSKAPFAGRDGAGGLVFNNRMWLIGGWNPDDPVHFPKICNNEVWSSADGADWTLEKPNTFGLPRFDLSRDWRGRHVAGYVVFQNKMWIVGGDPNQGEYQDDVWWSVDGKRWEPVNGGRPAPWGPRVFYHTLVFQDKIWVMGGQTLPNFAPAPERFYNDVWNSPDGIHWTQVKTIGPIWSPRGLIGGGAIHQGRMWIIGGGTYDTPGAPIRQFNNDVWSSDDGIHWRQETAGAAWSPREMHEVAAFDGRLWLLEGWRDGNRKDVWSSSDGVHWEELPDTPWAPRHAGTVFVYRDSLWLAAGNNMEPDVWRLDRV